MERSRDRESSQVRFSFRAKISNAVRVTITATCCTSTHNGDDGRVQPARPAMGRGEGASPARKRAPKRGRPPVLVPVPDAAEGGRLRSLSDMLGAGSSRAEIAFGDAAPDDAWASITNTVDNLGSASLLPAAGDSLRGAPEGDEAVRDALGPGERIEAAVVQDVPLDLALKRAADVVSESSLQWALTRAQKVEYAALRQVLSAGDADVRKTSGGTQALGHREESRKDEITGEHEAAVQDFSAALLHFRHPSAPLATVISSQWQALVSKSRVQHGDSSGGGDLQAIANARFDAWQDALRSLFHGYRSGHVDNFYVMLSTTTVLFNRYLVAAAPRGGKPNDLRRGKKRKGSASQRGTPNNALAESGASDVLRASFSRATPGLRALLNEHGVDFETVDGLSADVEPCVVVEGVAPVHALYNFVFSVGAKLANATDVPLLLCDQPFRGATLTAVEVSSACKTRISTKENDGRATFRHSVQVRGLLTPRQVTRLCHALSVTQNGMFTMFFKTVSTSSRLNVCGHGRANVLNEEQTPGSMTSRAFVVSRLQRQPNAFGYTVFSSPST